MRFGILQKYREAISKEGVVAKLYVSLFGSTNLFEVYCFLLFKKIIQKVKIQNVLDAGCGQGDYVFYLADKYKHASFYAVDLSVASSDLATNYATNIDNCLALQNKVNIDNIKFEQRNLLDLTESCEFDFIYCIHVLEHIEESGAVLSRFYDALKVGGHCYIQMPSSSDFKYDFLKKSIPERLKWEEEEHINLKTKQQLKEMAENAGFNVIFAKSEIGFLAYFAWQSVLLIKEKRMNKLGAVVLPFLKGLVYLDRFMQDNMRAPYNALGRLFVDNIDSIEGNLELLAIKK